MIVLNPFLDSLCNFGFKNIDMTPGIPNGCFQHPQDVVEIGIYKWYNNPLLKVIQLNLTYPQLLFLLGLQPQ